MTEMFDYPQRRVLSCANFALVCEKPLPFFSLFVEATTFLFGEHLQNATIF